MGSLQALHSAPTCVFLIMPLVIYGNYKTFRDILPLALLIHNS